MFNKILVVCIGNICRSPMGEYLLKEKLPKNIQVDSAGLGALDGYPADKNSIDIMQEQGVDISGHRARQITQRMISEYDLILVMSDKQKKDITRKFPESSGRVYRIGEWDDVNISDPFQKSRSAFEDAFVKIKQGVDNWVDKLK